MFKIQHIVAFIKCLSLRKLYNLFLVYISFYLTRLFKKPIQWGYPFSVSIEPTTSCNLRCPECPSGLRSFTRARGMLEPEAFENMLKQLKSHLLYLTFYFQGEPYLNKDFLKMVKVATRYKIYTSTSTNAHFLTDARAKETVESGLDRLIISIDGTTQETYEQYRIGGHLNKVLEGTKNIIKWKKQLNSSSPYVIFQFLVVRHNEHQIEDLKALAKSMNVDEVILKTAQVYDYENGNDLIPLNEKYSRYKKMPNGKYVFKNMLNNSCWKLWHSCAITWDGKIVPCCFDKDAKHILGDLQKDNFKTIWWNKNYSNFRKQLTRGRQEIDICKNCSEGCKVNFNVEID